VRPTCTSASATGSAATRSRGYIDQHRPDWPWHRTDAGHAHVQEHLTAYRQLDPDVPTDEISLP
jgi:hypothetical protein